MTVVVVEEIAHPESRHILIRSRHTDAQAAFRFSAASMESFEYPIIIIDITLIEHKNELPVGGEVSPL